MTESANNAAEEIDETVTTTDGDGTGLRSAYPPERPVGVEDPAVVQGDAEIRDDMVTRAWREEPEAGPAAEPVPGTDDPTEVPPPHHEPPDGEPVTEVIPRPETEVIPDQNPEPRPPV